MVLDGDRYRPFFGLSAQYAIEQGALSLPRKRPGHVVLPRLTDAALEIEVSDGVVDDDELH